MKTNSYLELVSRLNQGNPATGGLGNLRQALNSLPLHKLHNILEIGCNTGSSTIALSEMLPSSKVTGIDIDFNMIKAAKNNLAQAAKDGINKPGSAEVELADAQKLPYPNNTFDLVVSSGAFSFIEDRKLAMENIYRVLKPGGFLLTLDYFSKESQPSDLAKEVSSIIGLDTSVTTLDYWIDLHASQPFSVEDIEAKTPLMHAMSIKTKIKNIKAILDGKNQVYSAKDLTEFESYMDVFQRNEKHVGIINILVRKLETLSLLADGAN